MIRTAFETGKAAAGPNGFPNGGSVLASDGSVQWPKKLLFYGSLNIYTVGESYSGDGI